MIKVGEKQDVINHITNKVCYSGGFVSVIYYDID